MKEIWTGSSDGLAIFLLELCHAVTCDRELVIRGATIAHFLILVHLSVRYSENIQIKVSNIAWYLLVCKGLLEAVTTVASIRTELK